MQGIRQWSGPNSGNALFFFFSLFGERSIKSNWAVNPRHPSWKLDTFLKIIPWMKNTLPLHAPIPAGINSHLQGTRLLTLPPFLKNLNTLPLSSRCFCSIRVQAREQLSCQNPIGWKGLSSKRAIPYPQVSPTQLRRSSPAADPPSPAHFIWSQQPGVGENPQQEGKSREWLARQWLRERKEPLKILKKKG